MQRQAFRQLPVRGLWSLAAQLTSPCNELALEATAAAVAERRAMSSLAQTSYPAERWQSQGARLHSPAPSLLQQAGQRRGLFIQTQSTPNPASLMFQPGSTVMESGSQNFETAREAMASPLAKQIMSLEGVSGVFFGSDFVTVTKKEGFTWPMLKPDIFAAIMDHFSSGTPLFTDASSQEASDTMILDTDSDIVAMIKELLETRIRPAVQEDGGDITYKGFAEDTGVVTVKMQGACSGCPSSSVTLKSGIQNMLMHYIPEVNEVREAPPDEAEQEGMSQFDKLEQQLSL